MRDASVQAKEGRLRVEAGSQGLVLQDRQLVVVVGLHEV